MKRAIQAIPNHLLRQERELRGWSQQYVAQQIDAAPYYISRWECGLTTPSPHFRHKLCVLFGKDAKALGLLTDELHCGGEDSSQGVSLAGETGPARRVDYKNGVYDPLIPLLPNLPGGLIGRDELLKRLKQCVRSTLSLPSVPAIALNGLPGVGKTTLAAALAYDEMVRECFCDGMLWASLGPCPDVEKTLARWAILLGVQEADLMKAREKEGPARVAALAEAVHHAIGLRSLLIIIDDAWKIEDALACKIGGPNCAYLLTTRLPEVALLFAGQTTLTVRELNEEDSSCLLAHLAPEAFALEPQEVSKLAQLVGGLPLGITLMGNALRVQAYGRQPRRVRRVIVRLHSVAFRLRLGLPRAILEGHPVPLDEMPLSLWSTIHKSATILSPSAQQALCALAVFQPRPATFSEEEAQALAGVDVEALDALVDAGLLESDGGGRYALHATIADYACLLRDEDAGGAPSQFQSFGSFLNHSITFSTGEILRAPFL